MAKCADDITVLGSKRNERDKYEAVAFLCGQPSEILILDKMCPNRTRAGIQVFTWTKRCASEDILITS